MWLHSGVHVTSKIRSLFPISYLSLRVLREFNLPDTLLSPLLSTCPAPAQLMELLSARDGAHAYARLAGELPDVAMQGQTCV